MTEHLITKQDTEQAGLDESMSELLSTHASTVPNHEAYIAVSDATAALNEHPTLQEETEKEGHLVPENLEQKSVFGRLTVESERIYDLLAKIDTLNIDLTQLSKRQEFKDIMLRFADFTSAVNEVQWQEIASDESDRLLALISTMESNVALRNQYFWGGEVPSLNSILLHGKVPPETLTTLYRVSSNPDRASRKSFLYDIITANSDQLGSHVRAKVLADVYAGSGGVDNVAVGVDLAVDKVRAELGEGALTLLSLENDKPSDDTPEAISAFNQRVWERTDEYLLTTLQLSRRVVDRFYYAANGRFHRLVGDDDSEKSYALNAEYIARQLTDIRYAVSSFSPAEIDELTKSLGLVNLDSYNTSELETLQSLIKNDETTQEIRDRLRNKDLTVVFADAFGDYNGAFTEVHRDYATPATEVIRFEIQRPSDFYRYMLLLKKQGIKPSNIVIAGHGAPGNTYFGTQAVQFKLSTHNDVEEGSEREDLYPDVVLEQANLSRLFSDEFMRPNKKGGRKVFIHSCSGAAEEGDIRSTAETILEAIARTDTTMYAATDVMSSATKSGYAGAQVEYGVKYLVHEARERGVKESSMVELKLRKTSSIKRLLGRATQPFEMRQRKVEQAILSREAA